MNQFVDGFGDFSINHRSSIINHQSSIINHQSSTIINHSPQAKDLKPKMPINVVRS